MLPYLLTCTILFLSTLTRSTLGFGDAVVAMPLLALALGIRTAAPLVALVAATSTVIAVPRALCALRQHGPGSDWWHIVPAVVTILNPGTYTVA
jgi:hypothetical protein